MAHLLEQRIGLVRRQARRLLLSHALARIAAVTIATLLLVILLDYWIRFEDHGLRLFCSAAVIGALAWACYRFGWPAVGRMWNDGELARRIEARFPALANRLASSLDFLGQGEIDPQAGSAALRRAVILETSATAENLDFSQALEAKPTRRAATLAAVLSGLALLLAALFPREAGIALARLARPFGDDAWPKFYHVAFRDPPRRLAAGQTFEVELESAPGQRVPDEVRIRYRYDAVGGGFEEEVDTMRFLGGTVVARKERVARPFSYRAEGGDDRTPWVSLEVVEPPRVDSWQISLTPPAYSGLPRESSDRNILALNGTTVEVNGIATKRLQSATVVHENGARWPAEVSEDGYSFALRADAASPMTIEKSGAYWIELVDREGLPGGADQTATIRAVADLPPTLTIETPSGNIFVTPTGQAPVKITVKDDLAIHSVDLRFSRADQPAQEDVSINLKRGPDSVTSDSGSLASGRLGESLSLEYRWSLAALNLKPQTQLTFWATADDYSPQTGKSAPRKITIITPQELEERLAQRQALVVAELQRVLKLQQDARGKTKDLDIQLRDVGSLSKQDVDHAQGAELNQRQVARTLTSPSEGLPAQIADFLADLANNRIDSPDLERNMSSMQAELERLGKEHLGAIERELTSVIKAGQADLARRQNEREAAPAADPRVKQSLAAAGENQDRVIASLEHMLGELGQWDNFRRFGRDVAQLQREQAELAQSTAEMGQKTLGRELKDLDSQQQADLKKLATAQMELSRRFDKLQQQMAAAANELSKSDPLAADTILDGLHQAREQATSGQMRQSSERIGRNQLGQAREQQSNIGKDLEELAGILSNRREQELTRLVKQLREAEREMAELAARQSGLRKQMESAAKAPDSAEQRRQLERLAREEKQLQEQTARLARRLERLQAERAGKSTGGAAKSMARAGQAGEEGQGGEAGKQAQQAERDLEEAAQQLAQRRRQAEEDLAREQVAKMEDALKSLHERQLQMISETTRLEEIRAKENRLTRAQLSTLSDLARQQHALQTEVGLLGEKLALAEVIHLALSGAGQRMGKAAELLSQQETGQPTQAAEEAAGARLAQLLKALERDTQTKPGQEGGNSGGSGGGEGGEEDGDYRIAQLKVLRALQEDVNHRYRELIEDAQASNRNRSQDLADVAAEQGKLAELTLKLSTPTAVRPEDDPDSLPDLRGQQRAPNQPDQIDRLRNERDGLR